MSNRNDGGPAFPQDLQGRRSDDPWLQGMSLRDHFAAKTMQALLPIHISNGCEDFSFTAMAAYSAADAMMEAREK